MYQNFNVTSFEEGFKDAIKLYECVYKSNWKIIFQSKVIYYCLQLEVIIIL